MLQRASKKAKAFGVDIELLNSDIFDVELKMQILFLQTTLYSL